MFKVIMKYKFRAVILFWAASIAMMMNSFALAQQTINPPAAKLYIVDHANMIAPNDEAYINQIGDALLQEHRTPVYVNIMTLRPRLKNMPLSSLTVGRLVMITEITAS